ncbi:MAG: hypothetical protein AB7G17_03885 [Phycisphaerales bacterium]
MLPQPPPLALSLAGIPTPRGARALIDTVPSLGPRAVALDATHPELRPRALDASARRDLASLLRRAGLVFAGLDLWIPPEHFADPSKVDRAVDATSAACALAGDLARHAAGRALVSLVLPSKPLQGAAPAIALAAEQAGAHLADHAWPAPSPPHAPSIDTGIDPAALLIANADPTKEASSLLTASCLASARLSDAGPFGRLPVSAPGARLDVLAYSVALLTGSFRHHVILDVRGLPDHTAAVYAALHAWTPPAIP